MKSSSKKIPARYVGKMPSDTVIGGHDDLSQESADPSTPPDRLKVLSGMPWYAPLVAKNPNTPPWVLLKLSITNPFEVEANPSLELISIEDPSFYQEIIRSIRLAKAREIIKKYVKKHWWNSLVVRPAKAGAVFVAPPSNATLATYIDHMYDLMININADPKSNKILMWLCRPSDRLGCLIGEVTGGRVVLNDQGKMIVKKSDRRT